jgi:hypothetical protein
MARGNGPGRGRRGDLREVPPPESAEDADGGEAAAPKKPFVLCDEARVLGEELIPDYHMHLKEARVLYVFCGKPMTRNGRVVLAKAMKFNDLNRFFTSLGAEPPDEEETAGGCDFAVIVNRKEWEENLTPKQRRAVVDHELCHCIRNHKGKWAMRNHDVEEFAEIIDRHGMWFEDVAAFGKSVAGAMQLELPVEVGVR